MNRVRGRFEAVAEKAQFKSSKGAILITPVTSLYFHILFGLPQIAINRDR